MTTEIEAVYRVVTPLFCAGAHPKSAELRAPSFKGVLRFWWRALAWSRCDGDLREIRRQEDCLFGSSDEGRSRVSMRLALGNEPMPVNVGEVLKVGGHVVGEGSRYLGYGVMEAFASRKKSTRAGQLTRACLPAPIDFTVRMRIRERGLSQQVRERQLVSLKDALVALGTFGCMGARSRRGYGSLVIRSLLVDGVSQWQLPQSIGQLGRALGTLRRDYNAARQPEYTALWERTRILLVPGRANHAMGLLDLVGRELMRYRSWGHNGKVLGQLSERNFAFDHDLMAGPQRNRHPARIAFGLPHNYGKGPHKQVGPADPGLDRRASPLFIHIHECGGTPVAVLSFLPARFLPEGCSAISVGGTRVRQTPENQLYRPVHDFLDRLLDPVKRKEDFTDVSEVTP